METLEDKKTKLKKHLANHLAHIENLENNNSRLDILPETLGCYSALLCNLVDCWDDELNFLLDAITSKVYKSRPRFYFKKRIKTMKVKKDSPELVEIKRIFKTEDVKQYGSKNLFMVHGCFLVSYKTIIGVYRGFRWTFAVKYPSNTSTKHANWYIKEFGLNRDNISFDDLRELVHGFAWLNIDKDNLSFHTYPFDLNV